MKIPIGISDFETIIENNYYYVDKTLLVEELLNRKGQVTLVPRPRRFGKTLNLSMIQYFFEKSTKSKAHLFANFAINNRSACMKEQGQYPVIFLTFKDVKLDNWHSCYSNIQGLIVNEFRRHAYLLDSSILMASEKNEFNAIIDRTALEDLYQNSLKTLSLYLLSYWGKKPIILIDEYDTPIHAGYTHDYYDNIISFMRIFLGSGLKDSKHEFALVTGILRVAKESIFSGLNNLKVCSLIDECNSDMFGFTQSEVTQLLELAGLAELKKEVEHWYDGYRIGQTKIYNPWSINNLVSNKGQFDLYWVNTSSNDIIKDLFAKSSITNKQDLETLISGKVITKEVQSTIVFQDLTIYPDALWNFLFFSGYLTCVNVRMESRKKLADFCIPNEEVLAIYESIMSSWFKRTDTIQYPRMLQYLINGQTAEFAQLFTIMVRDSLSYFDVSNKAPEQFYHAFVLGMIIDLHKDYDIKSNRESGYGRYDVMLIPKDITKLGIVFEFKKTNHDEHETLEQAADRAVQQIKDKQYAQELTSRGVTNILQLGIAFEGKKVLIKKA